MNKGNHFVHHKLKTIFVAATMQWLFQYSQWYGQIFMRLPNPQFLASQFLYVVFSALTTR